MVGGNLAREFSKKRSYGKQKGKSSKERTTKTTNKSALVRIYIEGGAEGSLNARFFREAWGKFLRDLDTVARSNGFGGLRIVQGGGRYNAHKEFVNHPLAGNYDLNILLLDSEIPSVGLSNLWTTLALPACGSYPRPSWATDDHLYLMVPTVEAWLMSDHDALASHYRKDFDRSKLMISDRTLEDKDKRVIESSLISATRNTKKGIYSHAEGNKIIEFIRPSVARILPHVDRLFVHLEQVIIANDPRSKP